MLSLVPCVLRAINLYLIPIDHDGVKPKPGYMVSDILELHFT